MYSRHRTYASRIAAEALPTAKEFVLVQSEFYLGEAGANGVRPFDYQKMLSTLPDFLAFNGRPNQYIDAPIRVKVGDRVRFWVVNCGPTHPCAFHVVGEQFDTVYLEGAYQLGGMEGPAEGAGAQALGWKAPPRVSFFTVLTDERARIPWGEIALSAPVAVLLAILVAVALNNNVLHGAAERLGISRRFGEPDVWGYFLNSPQTLWVAVRDLATDTMYEGWVEAFSDTGASPEILLRQVSVSRNSTGTKLFDCERVYLARDRTSLIIEQL